MKPYATVRYRSDFLRVLPIVVLLTLLQACGSGNQTSNDKSNNNDSGSMNSNENIDNDVSNGESTALESSVVSIIADIDPLNADAAYTPEDLVALGHDAVPALIEQLDSPDIVTRWACVYALTRLAEEEDIDGLVKGLEVPNLSNRARIAATMLWLGDERGLSILEEALDSDEMMIFSHPPESVAAYAWRALELFHPESLPEGNMGGSHVFALPAFAPLKDVSVSIDDCTVTIELNLQFSGPGASEALVSKWKQGILKMWHEQQSSYCCETDLTVNTKVGGATDPSYAQISVALVPPMGEHDTRNSLGGSVADGVSNDVFGWWASNDSALVAAHEVGHAMGVDDEYVLDASGKYAVSSGEAIGEDAGAGVPGIMAFAEADNEGQVPEAKERHIDEILAFYGEVCVCCGVIEWDINAGGLTFIGRIETCDGVNWHGTYDETLAVGPTTAGALTDFDFVMDAEAHTGTTDFVAEGYWSVDDETIDFQDNITFQMLLMEGGARALINSFSTGGILLVGGQSVPVPQAMPATTGELDLPVAPNESCALE